MNRPLPAENITITTEEYYRIKNDALRYKALRAGFASDAYEKDGYNGIVLKSGKSLDEALDKHYEDAQKMIEEWSKG